jgi:hypothetical protein
LGRSPRIVTLPHDSAFQKTATCTGHIGPVPGGLSATLPLSDNVRIARQSPGTLSYHQKPPNKPISQYGYPEKYDISIEYLQAKLLQVPRLRSL